VKASLRLTSMVVKGGD